MSEKFNILVVEDEQDLLELYQDLFFPLSPMANIVFAKDGKEALWKAKNQFFEIIITDLDMPKKSGSEFLLELKIHNDRNNPKLQPKIYVTSGRMTKQDVIDIKGMYQDNIHFLVKPINYDELFEVIKKDIDFDIAEAN
jgi:CheY-like chemotaxis protein